MEPADTRDLELASRQGTILEIRVNGKLYGRSGRFPFLSNLPTWAIISFGAIAGLLVVGLFTFAWKRIANSAMLGTFLEWIKAWFNRKELPNSFKEHFHIEDDKTVDFEDDDGLYNTPLSYVYH